MFRSILFSSACLLGGCFALNDVDRFDVDPGCDLDMELRVFTIHADRHLFSVEVVSSDGENEANGQTRALAQFDPLPIRSLDLHMPGAVPPKRNESEREMSINFFADRSDDGLQSPHPDDHTWKIQDACVDPTNRFVHVLVFDTIPVISDNGDRLIIDVCSNGLEDLDDGNVDNGRFNVPFEIRVRGLPGPDDVGPDGREPDPRAIILYSVGDYQAQLGDVESDGPLQVSFGKAIDAMQSIEVEIIFDQNRNGRVDGDDRSLRYDYDLARDDRCEELSLGCDTDIGFGCIDLDGNVRFTLNLDTVPQQALPREEAWWTPVAMDDE